MLLLGNRLDLRLLTRFVSITDWFGWVVVAKPRRDPDSLKQGLRCERCLAKVSVGTLQTYLALTLQNLNFLTRFTGNFTEVKFRSFIHVKYDTHRYVLDTSSQKVSDVFHVMCGFTVIYVDLQGD